MRKQIAVIEMVAGETIMEGNVVEDIDNTKNMAEYLNMSQSWARQARMRGDGPPFLKIGRTVRYRKTDVDEWMIRKLRKNTIERAC
ncbi:MAG TPA: helix-turn-helix domain-containing protein [Pseudobdellovibrionaceae bacterium]